MTTFGDGKYSLFNTRNIVSIIIPELIIHSEC